MSSAYQTRNPIGSIKSYYKRIIKSVGSVESADFFSQSKMGRNGERKFNIWNINCKLQKNTNDSKKTNPAG